MLSRRAVPYLWILRSLSNSCQAPGCEGQPSQKIDMAFLFRWMACPWEVIQPCIQGMQLSPGRHAMLSPQDASMRMEGLYHQHADAMGPKADHSRHQLTCVSTRAGSVGLHAHEAAGRPGHLLQTHLMSRSWG